MYSDRRTLVQLAAALRTFESWKQGSPVSQLARTRQAVFHGTDDPVVLFGVSMGAALVGQYLDRDPDAAAVTGVVLDSPVLSLDDLLVLHMVNP